MCLFFAFQSLLETITEHLDTPVFVSFGLCVAPISTE